jgi:hypothetical protein
MVTQTHGAQVKIIPTVYPPLQFKRELALLWVPFTGAATFGVYFAYLWWTL